ncbi:PAS domain S-box protein [Mucilaginibacter rigui]|uniref:PAS domain S-box protein n=1 Tax=Mucilaginibacter rigui TaxID=534635 RepID=A0ABR7X6F7_9SPHI|nr:PAS domain S-box protein [Mucilaginibacter rigui]MBD1386168.1 PAS domain S-box protein [Mucilaginibacter rigui]
MFLFLKRIWKTYKIFIKHAFNDNVADELKDIHFWREDLFIKIILYATPLSLVAIIPSIIILLNNGYRFIPFYYTFALITIPALALNNHIKPYYKKLYVIVVFYLMTIFMMASLGSFGGGSIYLMAMAVFITALFSGRAIAWSLIVNIGIYSFFSAVIYFKLFNSPLIVKYPFDSWILYSSNFLFLNISVVVVLRHIIIGLEKTIIEEALLRKSLQQQVNEKNALNSQLLESEGHYKSLFFRNPSPMWIFDTDTLQFLQVNGAAIRKYGYTRSEFKSMTIKNIRPVSHVEDLLKTIEKIDPTTPSVSTVMHKTKNGKEFYSEVRCSNIVYQGKNERLVIARDITDSIKYTQAIEKQNAQLREIAYMQSHIVRAPLCRILGLINMINIDKENIVDKELMGFLEISANELDEVIKAIISKTESTNINIEK